MMCNLRRKWLAVIKLSILGFFIILLIQCCLAYNAAKELKKELIEQFETGYIDYLYYVNAKAIPKDVISIFPKEIEVTFKSKKIFARYIMLKDGISLYNKAKVNAEKDGLFSNNIKLYLLNEMSLIIPSPFNKVHMDLYFREFARVDDKYDIEGNIRKLEIVMIKKRKKWDVEYIINKPRVITRSVV